MTEISFYHLQSLPVERALPKLMERVLAGGMRALVRSENPDRLKSLNEAMWTYEPASFLPHGTNKPEQQPILLSEKDDNKNEATVLVLLDNLKPDDVSAYDRVLYMFEGDDPSVVKAREHWTAWKDADNDVTYWQQSPEGKWEKKA